MLPRNVSTHQDAVAPKTNRCRASRAVCHVPTAQEEVDRLAQFKNATAVIELQRRLSFLEKQVQESVMAYTEACCMAEMSPCL